MTMLSQRTALTSINELFADVAEIGGSIFVDRWANITIHVLGGGETVLARMVYASRALTAVTAVTEVQARRGSSVTWHVRIAGTWPGAGEVEIVAVFKHPPDDLHEQLTPVRERIGGGQ